MSLSDREEFGEVTPLRLGPLSQRRLSEEQFESLFIMNIHVMLMR